MGDPSRQPTLFPTEGRYALWGRESGRHKWRVVTSADTRAEALAGMGRSGIKNGEWMILEAGRHPDDTPTEESES